MVWVLQPSKYFTFLIRNGPKLQFLVAKLKFLNDYRNQTVLWTDLKLWIFGDNCYVANILQKIPNVYIAKVDKDKKKANNRPYKLLGDFLCVVTHLGYFVHTPGGSMVLHHQPFQPGHLSPWVNSPLSTIHHGGIWTPRVFTLVDVSPLSMNHRGWNSPLMLTHHGTQFTTKFNSPLWMFTIDQITTLQSFN